MNVKNPILALLETPHNSETEQKVCLIIVTGLQIYGGPGSLSHDFKIWPITFLGSEPIGIILFSCEKNLTS